MNLESLNTDYAIPEQLTFEQGPGGFTLARIKNALGEALISTYGGQILSYKPTTETHDLLFLSNAAYFQTGKAIKGGAPVCWPWFGPDQEGKGPAHGFVRNRQWDVIDSEALGDGGTRLVLGLDSNEETRAIWPYDFELRIEFRIGSSLEIALLTANKTTHAMALTQALHTYFHVGDVMHAQVHGLDGNTYIDKLDNSQEKTQQGPVEIGSEVDRIYTGVEGDLVIDDASLERRIRIQSLGSHSAVVWNPWKKVAAAMGDLRDDEYPFLLCVETTNAGPDVATVAPGEEYRLGVRYSVEPD